MDKYRLFEIKDFITDAHFIDWVLNPNQENDRIWQQWLTENTHQAENIARARTILQSIYAVPVSRHLSLTDVALIVGQFQKQALPPVKKLWGNRRLFATAIAAILLVAVSLFFYLRVNKTNVPGAKYPLVEQIVNNGHHSRIVKLPDNSLVILRPYSTLKFFKNFLRKNRLVFLTGTAFFEVQADKHRPFIVQTKTITVKVLGTSFDIVTQKNKIGNSVVVKTGEVKVYYDQNASEDKDSLTLVSNQKAVFASGTPGSEAITAVKPQMLSPTRADKIFSYKNAPLAKIITSLHHAYDVEIIYDEQKYRNYTVTASLSKLPLEEKIRAICKAIGADYHFEENKISIY